MPGDTVNVEPFCDNGNHYPSRRNGPSVETLKPCVYPNCRNNDGKPRLTQHTICDGCRNHYANQIQWIIEDFVTLKTTFPKPPRIGTGGRSSAKPSYGHPGEWASYNAAEIAEILTDAHAALRDRLGLNKQDATRGCEAVRVRNAQHAIRDNWHTYCELDDAGIYAEAIVTQHKYVRNTLGHNKFVERLPTPCPTCEIAALTRDCDQITCGNCGRIIRENEYADLAMHILDNALDAYETRVA